MTYATGGGTRAYAEGQVARGLARQHFREAQGLALSSIGLGTYLGFEDDKTDRLSGEAVLRAVERGCNVLDTAINYRCQRSERVIGQAIRELSRNGVGREQVVVATKGGFLPFDGEPPQDLPRYFKETFLDKGIMTSKDLVAGCHCMTPLYLESQLEWSLANLGLQTIDIYYLHNPETQLSEVPREEFVGRLRSAFVFLERAVAEGKIRFYGTATWDAYRRPPAAADYLSVGEVAGLAREVGGEGHHFRFIQLPYNLTMTEAFTSRNQELAGKAVCALEAASELGITVMSSASILQSRLSRGLPDWLGQVLTGLATDAQRAIQFVRSTPYLTTALVGMKQLPHVEENLAVARLPPAPLEDFLKLFEVES